MWNPLQLPDSRSDEILDWILDSVLHTPNNRSATQTGQITGKDSTPDISPWEQLVRKNTLETSRAYS